jgi:carboxyl-terminal processing protease
MPMVVLVNNGTASSSEIVGGALQDLDRAVILGTRTFGKGLVQTTRNLPYNSMLKVTTAKYYIPSGRCIQAIDYGQRNGNGRADRIPDSLTHAFSTRLGRIVRDGGGIQPDVVCQTEMDASICYDLMDGYYFFDYANEFRRKHASIDPIETFVLTDDIYQDFLRFVKARGFSYEKQSQKKLAELRQTIEDEALTGRVGSLLDSLETRLSNTLDEDFVTYRQEIELYLSTEIVNRYYYQRGELRQSLKYDPCLKKAIDLVENEDAYLTLLNRKKS